MYVECLFKMHKRHVTLQMKLWKLFSYLFYYKNVNNTEAPFPNFGSYLNRSASKLGYFTFKAKMLVKVKFLKKIHRFVAHFLSKYKPATL